MTRRAGVEDADDQVPGLAVRRGDRDRVAEAVAVRGEPLGRVGAGGERLQRRGVGVDHDRAGGAGRRVGPAVDAADAHRVGAVGCGCAVDQPVPDRLERAAAAGLLEQDVAAGVAHAQLPGDGLGEAAADGGRVDLPVAVRRERSTRLERADDRCRAVARCEVGGDHEPADRRVIDALDLHEHRAVCGHLGRLLDDADARPDGKRRRSDRPGCRGRCRSPRPRSRPRRCRGSPDRSGSRRCRRSRPR